MKTIDNKTPDSFLPENTPCREYPFWEYLNENIDNQEVIGSRLKAIKSYMVSLGLVPYKDFFDGKTSTILKGIFDLWDYQVIRPTVLENLKNGVSQNA